jgi:hypothetical protein
LNRKFQHIEEKFYPCTYISPDTVVELCQTSTHLEAFTQAVDSAFLFFVCIIIDSYFF